MSLKFIAQKIGRLLPDEEKHKIGLYLAGEYFILHEKLKHLKPTSTQTNPMLCHRMHELRSIFFPKIW